MPSPLHPLSKQRLLPKRLPRPDKAEHERPAGRRRAVDLHDSAEHDVEPDARVALLKDYSAPRHSPQRGGSHECGSCLRSRLAQKGMMIQAGVVAGFKAECKSVGARHAAHRNPGWWR